MNLPIGGSITFAVNCARNMVVGDEEAVQLIIFGQGQSIVECAALLQCSAVIA